MLDWLGVGSGLPILIWLTALLGCFTLCGVALQQVATAVVGEPLHWGIASAGALAVGGLLNRFAVNGLTRIMPTYESTVISTDDLLMRRGTVLEGAARRGQPARAKVIDQHRQAHYIMVEPHHDDDVIAQGETALLVRKEGSTFYVLPDVNTTLRPI
ncbi:MAG: OB-fold-containig protein [Novosphingobium sp.]